MNIETLSWDKEILNVFGIPEASSRIDSTAIYRLAKERSIQDVAIAGILGDHRRP